VAGIGLGGTLLVSGMVARKNVNGLVIREKVKNHGTQLALEGPLVTKVVLLEDVITTGQSCEKAIKILSENGISVTRIITVINRKDIDSINHIPVKSLLYSKDLDAKKKEKTICI
jgi:orotate phosphoribosyltransferase